jgi:hypothetical protein
MHAQHIDCSSEYKHVGEKNFKILHIKCVGGGKIKKSGFNVRFRALVHPDGTTFMSVLHG